MSKYKKGDKFIIELDEQMGNLWRVKGFSTLVFDDFGLDRLGQLVHGVDQFSYNKGADDAWELVKKLFDMERESAVADAFNYEFTNTHGVLGWLSYKAAAEKVEAWEKEKSEIRVGDVVLTDEGYIGVVTYMRDNYANYVDGIRSNGVAFSSRKSDCTKTGRHIDIEAVLDQIK